MQAISGACPYSTLDHTFGRWWGCGECTPKEWSASVVWEHSSRGGIYICEYDGGDRVTLFVLYLIQSFCRCRVPSSPLEALPDTTMNPTEGTEKADNMTAQRPEIVQEHIENLDPAEFARREKALLRKIDYRLMPCLLGMIVLKLVLFHRLRR